MHADLPTNPDAGVARLDAALLRHDGECADMEWAHVVEVASVQRRDCVDAQPFAHGDDGGVGSTKVPVGVLANQHCHAEDVAVDQAHELVRVVVISTDVVEEGGLCLRAESSVDEVAGLGDHGRWHQERLVVAEDPVTTADVMRVRPVGCGVENARVDDDQGASAAEALGENLVHSL